MSSLCSPVFLFYLLCSDMFLPPSPKFPSFRVRSEASDCDLPWGWVKDSPPTSLLKRMAVSPHLFILYTPESLLLPWIHWQSAERKAAGSSFHFCFVLFGQINKFPAAKLDGVIMCVCLCVLVWVTVWMCICVGVLIPVAFPPLHCLYM